MLDIFGSIKNYALIALGALAAGLAVALKLKSAKNKKLKSDVKLQKKNVEEVVSALEAQEQMLELNDEANQIEEDIRRATAIDKRNRLRKYQRNQNSESADV